MKTSNWQELQSRVDDRSDNSSYKYVEKIDFLQNKFVKKPNQGLMTDMTDDVCTCGLHFPMLSNSSSTAAKGDVSHQKINDLSSAPSY